MLCSAELAPLTVPLSAAATAVELTYSDNKARTLGLTILGLGVGKIWRSSLPLAAYPLSPKNMDRVSNGMGLATEEILGQAE